jgi:hypothetical protein
MATTAVTGGSYVLDAAGDRRICDALRICLGRDDSTRYRIESMPRAPGLPRPADTAHQTSGDEHPHVLDAAGHDGA